MAQDSWMFQERAATVFAPPLYYVKSVIPVGVALLFLQGVSNIIHDINAIVTGKSEDLRIME